MWHDPTSPPCRFCTPVTYDTIRYDTIRYKCTHVSRVCRSVSMDTHHTRTHHPTQCLRKQRLRIFVLPSPEMKLSFVLQAGDGALGNGTGVPHLGMIRDEQGCTGQTGNTAQWTTVKPTPIQSNTHTPNGKTVSLSVLANAMQQRQRVREAAVAAGQTHTHHTPHTTHTHYSSAAP